jgi:hypothetical protein
VIRTAARRASVPVVLIAGAVAVVAAVAALAGASPQRAVALGLYAVGSFMTIVGFALGSRSLFRSADHSSSDANGVLAGLWETTEAAALLILIGLFLLGVGTAVDPRARLI